MSKTSPPSTMSSLLVRIRDPRDGPAWDQFMGIYFPMVHRYCRRCGLQDSDASDVAQAAMQGVVQAIGRFEYDPKRGRFRDWLFVLTRSKLRDFFGRLNRYVRASGG